MFLLFTAIATISYQNDNVQNKTRFLTQFAVVFHAFLDPSIACLSIDVDQKKKLVEV